MTPDYRSAAGIVEDALSLVVDPGLVRSLRPDSPLSAAGLDIADAVCIADAVSIAAERAGVVVELDDADLEHARCVDDLVRSVLTAMSTEES